MDYEKTINESKVKKVADYDDGRPDIYRVENKAEKISVDVEAESVEEAREKALEALKNSPFHGV